MPFTPFFRHLFCHALILLSCAPLSVLAETAQSLSVESILEQMNEATGGKATLAQTSYTLQLRFEEDGKVYYANVWGRPPYDYRLEISVPGLKEPVFTESSNGQIVWSLALQENGYVFEEKAWKYQQVYDFYGPTIDAEAKQIEHSLLGCTTFGYTSAYKILSQFPDGETETLYVAKGSFLPLGFDKDQSIDNETVSVRTFITEYDLVDDVLVAKSFADYIDETLHRRSIVQAIEFNQPLPDYLFNPPPASIQWR